MSLPVAQPTLAFPAGRLRTPAAPVPDHPRGGSAGVDRILVVGVGNELLSDDGVGVHAVRALNEELMAGVTAIEVGTAVLHALDFLKDADRVLVIDAATGGHIPGTIYLFDGERSEQPQGVTSIHAMGLREAATLLLPGERLPSFTVLGVEPWTIEYGMSLSEPVERALPRVLSVARQTIRAWQSREQFQATSEPNFRPEEQL